MAAPGGPGTLRLQEDHSLGNIIAALRLQPEDDPLAKGNLVFVESNGYRLMGVGRRRGEKGDEQQGYQSQ